MDNHYRFSDFELEEEFRGMTLHPKYFNHEAHLRLAWIHIRKYGIEKAIDNLCIQIYNYANYLGANDKFNKTVTVASIRAVYHFMLKSNSENFKTFIGENPRLNNNFKELLAQHYDIDIWNNETARSSFLQPDLLPFD
ncbi:MAG: hypothetical protein KJN59_03810 [Bacteroidia bacterium]|nr:hypothetical protein [Bacteroidia bacterium]